MLDSPIRVSPMKFSALMVLVGLSLLIGDLRFISADFVCGDGAVKFNNECYLIQQGSCPANSWFIRDKCCRENCVRTCTAENCWHCCEVETPTPPQITCTSNNQNCFQDCSKCGGTSCQNSGCTTTCNQCSCQSRNCCVNTNCNTACNQGGGCQQINCGGSTTNQAGCQQTNCGNCNTTCNQGGGCQQINCGGSTTNQCGCQQTNCANCVQQTNCANCAQQTNCANCVQQTNCANCVQQTNCANCGGSNCRCNNTTINCPIPPVYPTPPPTLPPTQPPTLPPTQPPTLPPTQPPTLPPTPPTTTQTPPPPPIVCPPGTIFMGLYCHPLYCPKGTIMIKNECIVLVCPADTVWNGHKCAVPEPTTHNITFINTVVTHSNVTRPVLNLNNFNNITINTPVVVNGGDNVADCDNVSCKDEEDYTETTTKPLDPPPGTDPKCCTVMTPRTCERRNNRWYCYSRRSERCGDFCMAPVIYLRPPRVYTRPRHVVVPPLSLDCNSGNNCGRPAGGYDCSGCALGLVENCSQYCYRYSCPSPRCGFYDQQTYCINNPGSYGCMEDDGCFDDDWCS